MKKWILFLLAFLFPCQLNLFSQSNNNSFSNIVSTYAGIYKFENNRYVIIMPHSKLHLLSYYDMKTGNIRPLKNTDKGIFIYGPNILSYSPEEGKFSFSKNEKGEVENVKWVQTGNKITHGKRVPYEIKEIEFNDPGKATLSGSIITPGGKSPFPTAVISGPGPSDRYKLWRVAMSMVVKGIRVMIYDKRGTGKSTGNSLDSYYYTRSLQHSEDLIAAISFAKNYPGTDSNKVGVIGWSQTGWLGAIAAAKFNNLAFYVNIASNCNPGWEQDIWNKITELRYRGFSEDDVSSAKEFLNTHFGVMHNNVSWSKYQQAINADSSAKWFNYLKNHFRYLWKSKEDALNYAAKEKNNIPANDFRKVTAPTLGIFFEYDESSPPESPEIFLRSRLKGKNHNIMIRVFPNTSHEGFVVPWYSTKARESNIKKIDPGIFQLLQSWVLQQITKP